MSKLFFSEDKEIIILVKDTDNDSETAADDNLCEEEEDSDLPDNDENYIHLNVNYTDHLQSAKTNLKELLIIREFNNKTADELITNYNLYIETAGEIFSFLKTSKNDYSQVQILNSEEMHFKNMQLWQTIFMPFDR